MIKRVVSTTSILICLTILISSATLFKSTAKDITTSVDINLCFPGDIDENGNVDVDDALWLQRHIAGFTPGDPPLIDESNEDMTDFADLNGDGILSVGDVTLIQQIAAESISVDTEKHEWAQTPKAVIDYLENIDYDPSDYSYSVIQNFAPLKFVAAYQQPIGVTIKTNGGTLDRAGYLQNIEAGDITVYNNIPNRNLHYSVSNNGKIYQIGKLKPTHFLRQIKCPNALNVRDLGGWTCDGGKVKYGLLIRGGAPTNDDRDVLVNQCGIRTQIDLRGINTFTNEYPTKSSLGDDIDFYIFPRFAWYSTNDPELWRMILRATFDSVKNNKPVYFNCAAGADRTGTVACVLEAILGMDQSDIDKEYELTTFYSGTATDATARRRDEKEWKDFVANICAKAPNGSKNKIRDGAVQFAIELGFTINEINDFRSSVINGTPEPLTVNN